ncbi:MAG: Transcriptional regulatory protein terminal [Chloroflexota bacterium]|nr:Transcriptional regulatory protein terminal [Chloroflexota bacterium]
MTTGTKPGRERPGPRARALEGEDLATVQWEDARHWISIYADLMRFKRGLLARIKADLPKLHPTAQAAADEDLSIIRTQMEGYQERLDLWYERLWSLQGLWVDPEGDIVRHQGASADLTRREAQLLRFLLDHPHRYYTATQIMTHAWADSTLFPEEVRNYVQRVRKILKRLDIPCTLVNRPGKGYSLEFRPARRGPAPSPT